MAKFIHNGETFHVDFISSMGKNDASFSIQGKTIDKRINVSRKNEYPKHGIERSALAAWQRDDTKRFREWCADRNENYLSRYQ